MKCVFLISFVIISQFVQSQNLPDNFKIGDYVEIFDTDSILVYFNCSGAIVSKDCAKFVRKGRIDSIHCNVSGEFFDYDLNGNLLLKANMQNDFLNGVAVYYHENGQVKAKGNYLDDVKNGVWFYYYPNGQLEKLVNFVNGHPLISAYYNKKGKQKIINGNGRYEGYFYPYMKCTPYAIKGNVVNGKMDGKWQLINSISLGYDVYYDSFYLSNSRQIAGYEEFNEGDFIVGYSMDYTYTDNQLIQIDGYWVNEHLVFYENLTACLRGRVSYLQYKGDNLEETFYPDLLNSMAETISSELNNQWLIIGLHVNNQGGLDEVNVKSSIHDDILEKQIYDIICEMKEWNAVTVNHERVDTDLFFSILIRNKQFFIPAEYQYRAFDYPLFGP